jgi:ribosomal protein S18
MNCRDQFPLEPMNVNLLLRFMNPSGFIKPRNKTGLCRTMQQRVARTIKHARTLGLFSYRSMFDRYFHSFVL